MKTPFCFPRFTILVVVALALYLHVPLHAEKKSAPAQDEEKLVDEARLSNVRGRELYSQGRYDDAEKEWRKALDIYMRVLGPEHVETLENRLGVAIALEEKGKHVEAEKEFRTLLVIHERKSGSEDGETLRTRDALAGSLDRQAKHAEAEKECRAVLAIRVRVFGAEHPETVGTRQHLANVLTHESKHAEAAQEYRAVLAARERGQGANGRDVLKSCLDLAWCLERQDQYAEALAFARRAERGMRKTHDSDEMLLGLAEQTRERLDAKLKKQQAGGK